jgi:hypothetical protein
MLEKDHLGGLEMSEDMVLCPQCEGKGYFHSYFGGDNRPMQCGFCYGEGKVAPIKAASWVSGQALQDDRMERGLSLRQEAARLRISPREISDREWGRDD